ncbi:MAG: hypothetical protein ACM3S1_13940 [Hyphomicrobiales bacterium]
MNTGVMVMAACLLAAAGIAYTGLKSGGGTPAAAVTASATHEPTATTTEGLAELAKPSPTAPTPPPTIRVTLATLRAMAPDLAQRAQVHPATRTAAAGSSGGRTTSDAPRPPAPTGATPVPEAPTEPATPAIPPGPSVGSCWPVLWPCTMPWLRGEPHGEATPTVPPSTPVVIPTPPALPPVPPTVPPLPPTEAGAPGGGIPTETP